MYEVKLKTGKKAKVKDISVDKMDDLKDIMKFVTYPDGSSTINNVSKHRTAWLRNGLSSIGDWTAKNGEIVPDNVLKLLTEAEKDELFVKIQEKQVINP